MDEQEDMRRRECGAATSYFLDDLSNLHEEEEKPIAFPHILHRKKKYPINISSKNWSGDYSTFFS
jgi:hypothetical protein